MLRKLKRSVQRLRYGIAPFSKFMLELQSNCNRTCFFCPRQNDRSGKRRDAEGRSVIRSMPTEQAMKLLQQAAEMNYRGLISFAHLSEPFLDPRTIEMAREARRLGMKPYEHTNGDILGKDDELAHQAAGVMEYLVVGLYDYENDRQLQEMKRRWQDRLAGTKVKFSEVGSVVPRTDVDEDGRLQGEKTAYPDAPCSRPEKRLIVHYDGEVALCCEDMTDTFRLGNAFETHIRDIWYSEKHRTIVRDLRNGRRAKYPLCARCAMPAKLS